MELIDMHMHSIYSDGDIEPNELIDMCINSGITTMSITDHENMRSYNYIDYDRFKDKIELFNGVELSAKVKKGRLHILGYGCNYKSEDFIKSCDEIRTNSFYSMINQLNQIRKDYDICFSPKEIQHIFNADHNIGKYDLASLFLKKGYVSTIQEAFDKYLNPSYAPIRGENKVKSHKECIDIIKKAGGIPVLAHPNQLLLTDDELYNFIVELLDLGLEGLEVYHSGHSKKETEYYIELANKFNLIKSGGSDYHGPISKPEINLGNTNIHSLEIVDVLRKRKK